MREVVVIHHGDEESTRDYVKDMPADVLIVSDPQRELARLWHVRWTPFFVLTDSDGIVRTKGMYLRETESAFH